MWWGHISARKMFAKLVQMNEVLYSLKHKEQKDAGRKAALSISRSLFPLFATRAQQHR